MIINIDDWIAELKRLHSEFDEGCATNEGLLIERALYYSALIIRKFSETPFAKRNFLGPHMKGRAYAPAGGSIDGLDWLDAPSHFNFDKGTVATISLTDICNILIHSKFLDWRPGSGPVKEILVAAGIRSGIQAVGFSPRQFAKILLHVEDYKFKKLPLRPARRAA